MGEPLPEVHYSFTAGPYDPSNATVVHVHLREAMNDLFECAVVLAVPLEISPESTVTQPAKLELMRKSLQRYCSGIVRRTEDLGVAGTHRFVRLFVVPQLWLLSKRMDTRSRFFENKKTIEIIQDVLKDAGVYQGDGGLEIDGGLFDPAPREYCVQYHETDLDFVRRLMEDEGIPFYFKHDGGVETLVICDDAHTYRPVPLLKGSTVRVIDEHQGTSDSETAHWFDLRRDVQSTQVTVRDYDFTRPRLGEMTQSQGGGARAVYEYPTRATITNYNEGSHTYTTHNSARLAKVRLEEHGTREWLASLESNAIGMMAGVQVEIANHVHPDFDKKYIVTQCEHVGQSWSDTAEDVSLGHKLIDLLRLAGSHLIEINDQHGWLPNRYRNRVWANKKDGITTSVPYRPARITKRPIVEGPHTARVVGPKGEEIYTDFYGRVKVQFHWDRKSEENQKSSCWIRVTQMWAAGGWGSMFIPRIGMEVVVHFLEGDPDRPLIVGCVYNGENHPPYELPKEKTKSTIKSNTSPSDGGFNEFRFEDLKGKEQVFLQAQRNHDVLVKKDQSITVGNDRTKTIKGDEHIQVHKNREATITKNDKLVVEGNQNIEVHGGTGLTVDVDKIYRLEAGEKLILKVAESTIVMTADGIWINGAVVKLNCDGKPSA
jgi:type VI secretion system secreted protein VgrG